MLDRPRPIPRGASDPGRPWLVLGLGNTLVGDDAFGPAVTGRLVSEPAVAAVADVWDAHSDLLAWVTEFGRYRRVVLVDAVLDDRRPGHLAVYGETELSAWPHDSPSGHQISALLAVQLFHTLCPDAHTRFFLVGLSVPAVTARPRELDEAVIRAAVRAIRRLLQTP